jgi:hypothetical protein
MRVCTNTRCNTFGRIVYSVATRCPLCRWDLKPVSDINANPIPLQQVQRCERWTERSDGPAKRGCRA